MKTTTHHEEMFYINGWLVLGFLIFIGLIGFGGLKNPMFVSICIGIGVFLLAGFRIVQPNTAFVATLFGKYAGVLSHAGFYWIIPFYYTSKISLKTDNYITETLKVNDASGTPIEIAGAIVYHISNPASAVLDVENPHYFLKIQSESALRSLASHYPYTGAEESLSKHSDGLLQEFLQMVQERVELAGITIDEARFTHLSYAPEIAQAMLKKQQAEAVIMARQKLVEGAISMVEHTVKELEERQIAKMTEENKAKLIANMMTVLLADENASPVINVS